MQFAILEYPTALTLKDNASMNIYTIKPLTEKIIDCFQPTRLYIKELAGVKYFGKTSKDDVVGYNGSGKIWKDRIEKYGRKNIKTIWVSEWFVDPHYIQQFALMFSEINQIVESKEWANYIPEDGLSGGWGTKWLNTPESNKKKADSQRGVRCPSRGPDKGTPSHFKGKERSDSTKQKMRKPKTPDAILNMAKAATESHDRRAKRYDAINQLTNEKCLDTTLSEFSKAYRLSYVVVWEYAKKNKLYRDWRFILK